MKVNKYRKIVQTTYVHIFIICSLYLCYELYDHYKEVQNNRIIANIFYGKESDETEKMIQLRQLHEENSDIIGWISIPGTNIDYPVLQAMDNTYYLSNNYKKEFSKNGSIFLDKDSSIDKPSTNYLIYGHRNKNGQMFEDLIKFKKEEFYAEHATIRLTTLIDDSEYEIIAVFLSRVYNKGEKDVFRYYYFIDANSEEDFNDYVNKSKEASLYKIESTAEYGNQLLTLSTCEYSQEDGRFVIVAKKK